MKYPFKFKHYTDPMTIYTADKSLSGEIEVSWEINLRAGVVRYTPDQVKTNIDNGTWKIIEEEAKMKPITENIKIKVNPEQSAIVQEICFKQGIDWSKHCLNLGPAKFVKFADKPALMIDAIGRCNNGKCLYWQTLSDYNAECHTKEYTFEQFVEEFGDKPAKLQPRKHAELIKAWADGAEIQYKDSYEWYDCANAPAWEDNTEYRIKPAEPIIEKIVFNPLDLIYDLDLQKKLETCKVEVVAKIVNGVVTAIDLHPEA